MYVILYFPANKSFNLKRTSENFSMIFLKDFYTTTKSKQLQNYTAGPKQLMDHSVTIYGTCFLSVEQLSVKFDRIRSLGKMS